MSVTVIYRYYHPGTHDHLYTTNAEEIGTTTAGQVGVHGYQYEFTSFSLFTNPHQGLLPVYRYYHSGHNDHFYTTNIGEIGVIKAGQTGNFGYKCEGIIGYVSPHEFPGAVPIYRYWHGSQHDHFYTTNAGEIGTTTPGKKGKFDYVFENILGYAYPHEHHINTVHRYYHKKHRDHFYTTKADEIGTTTPGEKGNHKYKYEKAAFHIFTHQHGGLVPMYRYYHDSDNDHLYTTNAAEIGTTTPDSKGHHGYKFEEILGYVSPSEFFGSIPIYRYYNESHNDHLYTTDASEIGTTKPGDKGKDGYRFEMIAGYVPHH
jgi:hypothetical protein